MTTPVLFKHNESSSSTDNPSIDTWIRLAEYRDHPHTKGMQRFNLEAAEEIIRHFDSLKNRLRRTFIGVPIYVGHPDDPDFRGQPGHDDTKAYGWVKALEAREDGLWFYPKWSSAGRELLENAFYRFTSPRWTLKPLGSGVYQPIKLISIGLTNQPNLECDAIVNARDEEAFCDMEDLVGVLGLSPSEKITPAVANQLKQAISNFDEERAHWHQERQELTSKIERLESAANQVSIDYATELNMNSITEGLSPRNTFNIQEHFLGKVQQEMDTSGKDYLSAWTSVKQCMY